MPDTTAKIRAKGLEATGVTEETAEEMYNSLGRHTMAIVELKHEAHGRDAEGKKRVELVITLLEPSNSSQLDDHLRELTRTLHQNRALQADGDKLDLGDGINPKPADVIAAGKQLVSHEYVEGPDGVCDVCGNAQDDRIHIITDALTDDPDAEEPDPGATDDDEDGDDDAGEQEDDEEQGGTVTQLGERSPAFSS